MCAQPRGIYYVCMDWDGGGEGGWGDRHEHIIVMCFRISISVKWIGCNWIPLPIRTHFNWQINIFTRRVRCDAHHRRCVAGGNSEMPCNVHSTSKIIFCDCEWWKCEINWTDANDDAIDRKRQTYDWIWTAYGFDWCASPRRSNSELPFYRNTPQLATICNIDGFWIQFGSILIFRISYTLVVVCNILYFS